MPHSEPTRIFLNARVFTGTGEDDWAAAFRVTAGRFDRVGATAEVMADRPDDCEIVDLGGATVLPGLLDVHSHPAFLAALADSTLCFPPAVTSLRGLVEHLRGNSGIGQGPDVWIEGFGYDESAYPERRGPTADDLDQVSPDQPVFVRRCDGHSAAANHRALELAGITAATPDPPGARFGRDAAGRPDGRLIESAATAAVARVVPPRSSADRAQDLAGLDCHFLSRGIVGVADLWATMVPEPLATFRAAEDRGLSVQCALYYPWPEIVAAGLQEIGADQRAGRMQIAGAKLFLDGAYSNRTAWTERPYPGSCDHGLRTASDADLHAAVAWARRNRLQVAIHAMGDAAISHVLDLFADVEPWLTGMPSIRIEHATLFSPAMLDRLTAGRMRFGVVSHAIFLYAEIDAYRDNLDTEQFAIAYPLRSFFEQVGDAALASDVPATAWADADNVFLSVQAAVSRRAHDGTDIGQPQAVTVPQALLLYTGRARTLAPLQDVGLIAPGYEGSFVILDRDVFTVPVADIAATRVVQTWLAGRLAYDAEASTPTGS
ncbi:amidohydrolase [Nakamurella flava]|uniref:Amidohydrolase n=1 Tax=Nakamurella flava TaxID=2576308 RepID=A0A4U6QLZ3_9ACTN|nr:amidohydrolase family protein [Nakamurella flava]TKV61594.1 amidohydrolase [Nakamurella flava]